MKILILEDEKRVANQLKKMVSHILVEEKPEIHQCSELEEAISFIKDNKINLLLLDLNLNGVDGFELLKMFLSEPFETIVTSAYKEKAIDAFEYGVLDFVPKPFEINRLKKALLRYPDQNIVKYVKYLVIKKSLINKTIKLEQIYYLQSQGHKTLIDLKKYEQELHHKSLGKLSKILPKNFERVHKSFIVNKDMINEFNFYEGSRYELILKNGAKVPVGRKYLHSLKSQFE